VNDETIFDRAREIADGAERARFLDQQCAGNDALRREVESLLDAHFAGDNPLDREPLTGEYKQGEPGATATGERGNEQVGDRIGPYKLLQNLGEGGMGTVWVAEQEQPVKRRVALKLIKAGMDSAQVLRRFEAERQALALMDHTNIAKVLDAGTTPNGRPYFAMELVKGVPITKYCDELHLSIRERLDLFVPVCQAIQHAHQKGIIHRDIKPSNVLVAIQDGKPVPKVIDFGVAKATHRQLSEASIYTEIGQVIGTLEYMSPEQAELSALDIDTRTDVYALGVLLYELLTGTTPFDRRRLRHAAFAEMLRMIKEVEPPKPSTRLTESKESLASLAAQRKIEPAKLSKALRDELDWIVMKCLEKDRTRRYETANGLARDIQRYLSDEAVEARPPSTGYRLKKFARKNRRLLATAASFAVVLMVSAGVSIWQAAQATRARADAEHQRDDSNKQRRRTRAALDDMLAEESLEWLTTQKELLPQQRAFLERALTYYQEFASEAASDEDGKKLEANAQHRVASILDGLGRYEEAEPGYRRAIDLCGQLVNDYPAQPDYRKQLAASHNNLGNVLDKLGKKSESETTFRTAQDILSTLAAAFPSVAEYRNSLARVHNNLGDLLWKQGRLAEAKADSDQAIDILMRLTVEQPKVPVYRRDLARSQNIMGNLLDEMGKRKEAVAAYRRSVEINEQLSSDYPKNPEYKQDLAGTLNNLGMLLQDMRLRDDSEAAYRRAVVIQNQLAADYPGDPSYRKNLANFQNSLATILFELGKPMESVAALRQAIVIQERLASDHPKVPEHRRELSHSYHNVGDLLRELGPPAEAETAIRRAIELHKELATEYPKSPQYLRDLAGSQHILGLLMRDLGKRSEAETALRQSLEIREQLAADHPRVSELDQELAISLNDVGHLLAILDKTGEAENAIRRAITIQERLVKQQDTLPAHHLELARSETNLARLLNQLGKSPEAGGAHRRAAALYDKLSAKYPDDPSLRLKLVDSLVRSGDLTKAISGAEELAKKPELKAGQLYELACVFAIGAGQRQVDQAVNDRCATRAIELLRQAFSKDFRDVEPMKLEKDLDPLRDRDDFKQLLAEMEKAAAKPVVKP